MIGAISKRAMLLACLMVSACAMIALGPAGGQTQGDREQAVFPKLALQRLERRTNKP